MSTEHHKQSAQHHASKFTARQKTIALVIVALAFIMDLLDNTIVNIAIPSIQSNLGASYAAIQWLAAGYALTFAVLLITGGRMGDVFGYKKLFLTGVAGFTVASLLSGAAWNIEVLVGARLLQGAMAALMVPQVMSLMQVMYKPNERGKVMGLFGAMAGLAASLGPVVGGLLIQANLFGLDWRPIFLINIPVGIFAFFAAIKYLPEGKSTHPLKLDLIGTGLIVVALSLLIFPLIEGRDLDWPVWTFLMMVASLPFLAVFTWWQHKKTTLDGSPLVLPSLFKHYNTFSLGLLVNILLEMVMLGFFFTFTLLLQVGLGYSVLEAALTGIPTAVGISFSIGFLAQKLIPKMGRYALTLGAFVLAAGFITTGLMLSIMGTDAAPWHFIPGLLITGAGMGMIMGPIFSVTLSKVDPAHAGSGSGVLSAVQQLGGAIGIAAIGVLFFGQLGIHAGNSFDTQAAPVIRNELKKAHIPESMQASVVEGARSCFIDRTKQKDGSITPESCKKIEKAASQNQNTKAISIAINSAVKKANGHNFLYGFGTAIIYVLGLIVAIFGLSFLLPKRLQIQSGH